MIKVRYQNYWQKIDKYRFFKRGNRILFLYIYISFYEIKIKYNYFEVIFSLVYSIVLVLCYFVYFFYIEGRSDYVENDLEYVLKWIMEKFLSFYFFSNIEIILILKGFRIVILKIIWVNKRKIFIDLNYIVFWGGF